MSLFYTTRLVAFFFKNCFILIKNKFLKYNNKTILSDVPRVLHQASRSGCSTKVRKLKS